MKKTVISNSEQRAQSYFEVKPYQPKIQLENWSEFTRFRGGKWCL